MRDQVSRESSERAKPGARPALRLSFSVVAFIHFRSRLQQTCPDGRLRDKLTYRGIHYHTRQSRSCRRRRTPETWGVPQGDRILIPCTDVDQRLEGDLITGPWVVDQYSRWREIWACNSNVCGESTGQNSQESLLALTCLIDATAPKSSIY